jgi:predicted DNA-binding transcriptional regulator AlpA
MVLAARTLAETEDSLIRARKIEGMLDVRLLVLKELREYTQWMDSEIDRKIAETARRVPSPPRTVNARGRSSSSLKTYAR